MFKTRTRVVCLVLVMLFGLSMLVTGCGEESGKTPVSDASTSTDTATATTATSENTPSGEKVKIRFAHGWTEGGQFDVGGKVIKEYANDISDKYELVEEIVAGDEMVTKIKIDIAGNNIPDAWMYWGCAADAGAFVTSKLLLDIDEFFKVSTKVKKDDISDARWAGFTIEGKQWGIPIESYLGYWLCNKELFAKYNLELPKTYEDLLAVSKVFNENGIVPLAMGSKGGNPSHFFLSELFCQFPGAVDDMANLSLNWQFDTDNMHKTCEIIADMKKNNVFPSDTVANGDWGPSFALYNDGKAAMIYTFTWMLGSMKPEIDAASEIIDTPKLPGGTTDPATFVSSGGSYGLLLNEASFNDQKKQEALLKLGELMISDQLIDTLVYETGMIPARKQEIDFDKVKVPILKRIIDFSKDKEPMTNHWLSTPHPQPWSDVMNFLDELFAGSLTPDEYIEKIQKSLDKTKAEQ